MAPVSSHPGFSFGPNGRPLPYALQKGKRIIAFRSNIPRFAHLSNFHLPYNGIVTSTGHEYPSVEHGYQSRMACLANESLKPYILANFSLSPVQVKKQARDMKRQWSPSLRDRMENMRPHLMRPLLRAKFAIPELKKALLATGDASLVEVSPGDNFWGSGVDEKSTYQNKMKHPYYNTMGALLEEAREEANTGNPVGPSTLWLGDSSLMWLMAFNHIMGDTATIFWKNPTKEDFLKIIRYTKIPSMTRIVIRPNETSMFRVRNNGRKRLRNARDILGKMQHLIQQLKEAEGQEVEWVFHPRSNETEGAFGRTEMERLQREMCAIVKEDPSKWGFSVISETDKEMSERLLAQGDAQWISNQQ